MEYLDYYIDDAVYYEDTSSDGDGTANLEGNEIIYEFSMPVRNAEEGIEDIELNYNRDYDFKIVFGNPEEYPVEYSTDIRISNLVSLYLEYPPGGPGEDFGEILMSISTYIIFTNRTTKQR